MNNLKVLEELLNSYLDNKKDAVRLVSSNLDRLKEIDDFLSEVSIKSDDLKIFSPRSQDDIFGDDIIKIKDEKEKLLKENEEQYKLIDELSQRIDQIKSALDEDSNDTSNNDSISAFPVFSQFSDSDLNNNSGFDLCVNIQEKERNRIASELHDSTIQNLVHLIHSIELSSMFIDTDPIRAKLELATCTNILKSSIDGIRDIIFDLRPMSLNDLGLKKCIDDYISNMKIHYPSVFFNCDIDEFESKYDFNINVLRIIQECVTNSLKHSRSSDLYLNLKYLENSINIVVKDNGIGFNIDNISSNHFGLSIVEERVKLLNGTLTINSVIDEGTEVIVSLPI